MKALTVIYKTSSVGGMRSCDELLASLQQQLNDNPAYPCPVVYLLSDSYQHPKYGKIYNPVFEIIDWSSMDGELLDGDPEGPVSSAPATPPPAPPPAPAAPARAPVAARGRRAAAAPAAPPAPAEPEPTARRRPARRG